MSSADLFRAAVSKDWHDVSKPPIMEKLHEEEEDTLKVWSKTISK